jgi:hypothetical protein
MDVYEILIQDHGTIANIFEQIERTNNLEAERRLSAALEPHEVTEENDFLPELLDVSSFSADASKDERNWSQRYSMTMRISKPSHSKSLSCGPTMTGGWNE